MKARRITAREGTQSNVPPLILGVSRTSSDAVHKRLKYTGPLTRWTDFMQAVEAINTAQRWSQRVISLELKSGRLDYETVEVGDEVGLRARFMQNFGNELGRIFAAQSIGLNFADFKCLGKKYERAPDVVIKDQNQGLKVVGEIKVPWVWDHQISRIQNKEVALRTLLAQPIQYMQDLHCAFGFYSNYVETVFLRQVEVDGRWEVQYSEPVLASSCYRPATALNSATMSVKQCFLYVATLAASQDPLSYDTASPTWVNSP